LAQALDPTFTQSRIPSTVQPLQIVSDWRSTMRPKLSSKTAAMNQSAKATKKVVKERRPASRSLDVEANMVTEMGRSFARLLKLLSPRKQSFTAKGKEIAKRLLFPSQETVLRAITTAIEADILYIDWKASIDSFAFDIERYLKDVRKITLDIAPILAPFTSEEASDRLLSSSEAIVQAIANQIDGAVLVSFRIPADGYYFGSVASEDVTAFEHILMRELQIGQCFQIHHPTSGPVRAATAAARAVLPAHTALTESRAQAGVTEVRDAHLREHKEYLVQMTAELEEVVEECKDSLTIDPVFGNFWLEKRFERLLAWYSAGSPIAPLALESMDILCRAWPSHVAALPPGNRTTPATWPGHSTMVRWASLLVLAQASALEVKAFKKTHDAFDGHASKRGKPRDTIVETFVASLLPGSGPSASSTVVWPGAYTSLWRAIAPDTEDAERVSWMQKFVQHWYRRMKPEAAAQSGRLEAGSTAYVGYWCIEAAAGVIVANIDDRSFRDHPHYPAAWADWARAVKRERRGFKRHFGLKSRTGV
jgi:Domain of unknown function (DUF1911)